jgi:hypothetical protein
MIEYTLQDNRFVALERASDGAHRFRTYGELCRLGKDWSGRLLVDLYNTLAAAQGRRPVRRFMSRAVGRKRLWELLQTLPVGPIAEPAAEERVEEAVHVLPATGARGEEDALWEWQAQRLAVLSGLSVGIVVVAGALFAVLLPRARVITLMVLLLVLCAALLLAASRYLDVQHA